MSDGNSLINFGDLTKPATVLIEKISDAVGVLYQPRQIKRLAKAEAEAEKIKTLTKIELTEIEQRAVKRFVIEETIKQQNIENIIEKALPELKEDAKPEDIENDWLARFFEECKLISDEEMQSLWANLLAGEANEPGTFSKRTIDFVSNMDKSDAELFTNLCSFCINKEILFIYDYTNDVYQQKGLTFALLTHLDSIGLVKFDDEADYAMDDIKDNDTVDYFGTLIQLQFPPLEKGVSVGQVALTKIGNELAPICGAVKVDGFVDYCVKNLNERGYTVSFPDKIESDR